MLTDSYKGSVSNMLFFPRMAVLYFALSGLDLLDALSELDKEERQHIINWIYSLQILPGNDRGNDHVVLYEPYLDTSFIMIT